MSNVILSSRYLAERHFPESSFSRMSFFRIVRKMTFGWTMIRKNVVRHYKVSLIRRFGHMTIRSNDFRQFFFFGKTTIRQKRISVKRRFDEMTFRENNVAPIITNHVLWIFVKSLFYSSHKYYYSGEFWSLWEISLTNSSSSFDTVYLRKHCIVFPIIINEWWSYRWSLNPSPHRSQSLVIHNAWVYMSIAFAYSSALTV